MSAPFPVVLPFDLPQPLEGVLNCALRQPGAVFFDSADGSGDSYLAFDPVALLRCEAGTATHMHRGVLSRPEGQPLEVFERLERLTAEAGSVALPSSGFWGGWAGLLGFELRTEIEDLPPPRPGGPQFPDLQAGYYAWVLRLPRSGSPELRCLPGVQRKGPQPEQLAIEIRNKLAGKPSSKPPALVPRNSLLAHDSFIAGVEAVKAAIREGEIYQANLTREVVYDGSVDAIEVYLRLRRLNPAPFAGFLDCGQGRAVLSSSPESFLAVQGSNVITRPIKGTRPRASESEQDQRMRDELARSEKDRAELTMIVDLERNDLSRVCVPGSVKLLELHGLHTFESVHHMQATIEGTLRQGTKPIELLRAMFPGGSISGAPKKRALEILWQLEPVRRGPYTGSLFWLGPNGDMQANILIRTLLVRPGMVSFHVGGGITAASDPAAEWDETVAKGAKLAAVLEGR